MHARAVPIRGKRDTEGGRLLHPTGNYCAIHCPTEREPSLSRWAPRTVPPRTAPHPHAPRRHRCGAGLDDESKQPNAMRDRYDVAVVGLGAMGSTIARFLVRLGKSVVAFDRHVPPHDQGSSHGRTRMIREALYEHPHYVPMVRRSYELWRDMEHESGGKTFFQQTGALVIGPESGELVQGTLRSASQYRIPHEVLMPGKVHRRYPAFAPLDGMVAVHETRAGVLFPERIIEANLAFASAHGAELHLGEAIAGWDADATGGEVRAPSGTYRARHLVVAAGAWTPELLRELELPLTVERQVTHWLEPSRFPEYHAPDRMPCTLWELPSGDVFSTTPDLGDGVKTGWHHGGASTTPASIDRRVTPEEDAAIYDLLRRFVPFAKGEIRDRAVCMYTNTPDRDFVIDRHPEAESVLLVSACSGHGFKHAPVIAEAVTQLIDGTTPRLDLAPFSLRRLLDVPR
jgi:sarcosine oxidase